MSLLSKIRNVVQNEGARGIRHVLQKEGTKRFAQDLSTKMLPESFDFCETRRYGLPALVSAIAVDPVQGLLAAGTYKGVIAVTGAWESACYLELEDGVAIKSMTFQPGFPTLVVLDAKNAITVFDLIKQQRLFVRNARSIVTCMELLPGSNWLFHGLKDGTIDVFDVYRGQAVPYRIPNILPEGPTKHSMVISIKAHPRDNNQLLIAYNTGIVLWNLQQKAVIKTFIYEVPPGAMGGFSTDETAIQQSRYPHVTVISWRPDGQGFVSGYDDGCIVFWDVKQERPIMARTIHETQVNIPNIRRLSHTSSATHFVPIYQLVWCLHQNQQDSTLVVAGGRTDVNLFGLHLMEFGAKPDLRNPPRRQCMLPMDSDIMDFVVLPRESPWFNGAYDPIAIVAVTNKGGIKSHGFEAPYPLLRSPSCLQWLEPKVIFTRMLGNLPKPLYHRLLHGSDPKQAQMYHSMRLPLRGGHVYRLDETRLSSDILITVHADANVCFWEAAQLLPLAHLNADLSPLFHKHQAQITAFEFSPHLRAFACGFANGHWVYCQIEDADAISRRGDHHIQHDANASAPPSKLDPRVSPSASSLSQKTMPVQVNPEGTLPNALLGPSRASEAVHGDGRPVAPSTQVPATGLPDQLSTVESAPVAFQPIPADQPATSVAVPTDDSQAPNPSPSEEPVQREPSPVLPPRPLIQDVSLPQPTESQAIFKSSVHLGRIKLIAMSDCGLVAAVDEFYTLSITDSKTRQVVHIEDLKVVTWNEAASPSEDTPSGHPSSQTLPHETSFIEQRLVGVQITSLRFVISTTSDQDKSPGLQLVAGSNEGVYLIFSISSWTQPVPSDQSPPLAYDHDHPSVVQRGVRKVDKFQIKEKASSVYCAMINVLASEDGEGENTPPQPHQQQQQQQQSPSSSDHVLPSPPPLPARNDVRPSEQVPLAAGRNSLSLSDTASVASHDTVSSATSRRTTSSTTSTFMSSIREAQDKMKTKAHDRLAYFVCVTERGVRLHMNCTSRRIHKVEVAHNPDDPVTAMLYQQHYPSSSLSSSSSSSSPPTPPYQPKVVAASVISHEGSVAILCVCDLGQLLVYSVPKLELISPKNLRLPILTNEGRERLSETVILGDGRLLVPILKFEYRVYSLFGDDRARVSASAAAADSTASASASAEPTPGTAPAAAAGVQDDHRPKTRQRQRMPVRFVEIYDHTIQIPPRPVPIQVKSGWFGLGSSTEETPSQEDLDELFGGQHYRAENPMLKRAGVKGSPGTHQAGAEHGQSSTGIAGMMDQTIQALGERGERLDQLGDKTAQMSVASDNFLQAVRELNAKNANKKWYEF
ncbi:hypothetical protein DFQ27_005264 [Actinomortierella ambigua]|uniref:V-SNARE coiled-coil homology domain-containing protein n=1 Tax=Actinomortierella ambigua TaxID=1343610 RepID=A0A9P6Q120_9FUNG|nr:hypothetical protein DFQ27_005264 [Actinomortierella ambigua]